MQGLQWIYSNWYLIAIPFAIFTCIFVAGLVLRRVIVLSYDHHAMMPGHGTDRPMLLAILNAFALWCFLVGVTIAINICLPSASTRAFINSVTSTFFFVSLAWLAITIIDILFAFHASRIYAVLTRPLSYMVQTFIRAAIIVAGLFAVFLIWNLPVSKSWFTIIIGSVLVLFAIIDLIRSYQPDSFVRGMLKILLLLLTFSCFADTMRRVYLMLTDLPDDPLNIAVIILEISFLILCIAMLFSEQYASTAPGPVFAFFSAVAMVVVLALSGIEPFATDSASALTLTRTTIDRIPEFIEGKQTVYALSAEDDLALLAIEKETFRLVNVERQKVGVQQLTWSDSIHQVARLHSKNMLLKGALYHNARGIFSECCFGSGDLPSYHRTAKTIVDSFMSSKTGHKEAMLADDCSVGAVGIAQNDKGFFATLRSY
jgi:hypothetical protein